MSDILQNKTPKLGFGMMRLPRKDDAIDLAETCQMVDAFLDAGFVYFDTAWGYPGSEDAVREALVKRHPRDSYLLATKLPAWAGKSKQEAEQMLETSLARTEAGYFDFYLLHNLGDARTQLFEDYDLWNFIAQKKRAGILRHIGFSFHDKADALDAVLTAHPEVDFVQLQINYADWENPAIESRKCYETARKHGKPVIVMEPVKGGRLANPPEAAMAHLRPLGENASAASWAIRYAASLEGVYMVLSGMSDLAQMNDNLSYMRDFQPLTAEEHAAVERAGEAIRALPSVPCTTCGYCVKDCPQSVAIFGTFQAFNIYLQYGDLAAAKASYGWAANGDKKKASACIACGLCEQVCPQHIAIRDELKKAAAILE